MFCTAKKPCRVDGEASVGLHRCSRADVDYRAEWLHHRASVDVPLLPDSRRSDRTRPDTRLNTTIRYDTIRDAILTCARKPTWVGLIYRTETTTKNCKTEKLTSKNRYVRSNRHCSSAASAVHRLPSAVRTATPAFDVRSSDLFCVRPGGLKLVTRLLRDPSHSFDSFHRDLKTSLYSFYYSVAYTAH